MAIDFGRLARGVATGYLSAKIANTEANDRLKEDIIRGVGENYLNNTLPEFQKRERIREETYNKVSSVHGNDVAEYLDQQGLIVGDSNDYADIDDLLSKSNGINKDMLKAYLEGAQDSTYQSRKQKRFESMADQEKFVMGNMTKNGFGVNTLMSQLGRETTKEQPMAPTETQTIAPVPPEAKEVPIVADRPTLTEIFKIKEAGLSSDFSKLPYEEKTRIIDDARQEYVAVFGFDKLKGTPKVPESYRQEYNRLKNENSPLVQNETLESFAYDKFFKEKFLPKVQMGYREPFAVYKARQALNYQRSIGNEQNVNEIKQTLKDLGYNPNDYDL